jgi:hypothetical protein
LTLLTFPSLPGLGWSVTKAPKWSTRVQKAISGRKLRIVDQVVPIWEFTLVYNYLRDKWDVRGPAGLGAGYDELRTLAGFFLQMQGQFQSFLFSDPTDNLIAGQVIPPATSIILTAVVNAGGSGYVTGDLIAPAGGSGTPAVYTAVASGGVLTAVANLSPPDPGAYAFVPGSTGIATTTGGSGVGATLNLTWFTTTQLVRTFGGFTEPVVAPASVTNFYYNGVPEAGVTFSQDTGVVTLPAPFTTTPPVLTADFSYFFRVRFSDDTYDYENFMYQLWTAKKIKLESVLL